MLSFAFRRVVSHPGSFSIAQILPKHTISSNRFFAMTVQRNLATTADDRNSDSTANSESESESKPKSTRRKTGSSTEAAKEGKEAAGKKSKEARKKSKVVIRAGDKPPKMPGSAYILWLTDWMRSQPKFESVKEAQNAIKKGGSGWHTISEYDRQRYQEKFDVLRAEYDRRLEEWHEKVDPAVLDELNRRRIAKGRKRIFRKRARRPLTGYLRYHQHVLHENPKTEEDHRTYFKNISMRTSNQWRAMSDAEKAEYNDPAKADRDAWREKHTAESQDKA